MRWGNPFCLQAVGLGMNFPELHRLTAPDGPYVHWLNEAEVKVLWVEEAEGGYQLKKKVQAIHQPISCQPSRGPAFSFSLRPTHSPPPPAYPEPEKLLCLSDIEGNFEALWAILQGNGAIDASHNWQYGKNQLMLLGDLMDRDADVLPVLWLLYKLEAEAEKAGGKVHVLLGNHELMNLLGDLRYLHPKYKALAMQLSNSPVNWEQSYQMLFSEQAELRRWLVSKNTVEKIGNILFCHAGLSSAMQRYGLEEINNGVRALIRSASHIKAYQSALYGRQGPLWYRGYAHFAADFGRLREQELTEVLHHVSAKQMVIGHNLVPEIRADYAGKLISIDVHQEKGNYQALLIEKGQCFRVDEQGQKQMI